VYCVKVLLSVLIVWSICGVLTVTDVIPNDPTHWSYYTRVDTKLYVLHASPWFLLPYPCTLLLYCRLEKTTCENVKKAGNLTVQRFSRPISVRNTLVYYCGIISGIVNDC